MNGAEHVGSLTMEDSDGDTAASGEPERPTKRQTSERMLRKRARTRENVLQVAERLYAEAGPGQPRMEDLADEANVSIGLLYDHFGSKDGICLALAERALGRLSDYLDKARNWDCSPMQRVMLVGEFYLRWILDHPSVLQDRIEDAMSDAEADSSFDPLYTARFLWAAWNGVAALSVRADRLAFDRDQITDCLRLGRRLVNEGLTAPTFRDDDGRSKAFLVDPDGAMTTQAPPPPGAPA
jgi:AcrR family transcriptional regulator